MPRVYAYKRKRSAAPTRRATLRGRGAYRRVTTRRTYRRGTIRGRGGYYISGGAYARGRLGVFKGGAALNAGYSSGTTSAPKLSGLGAYNMANIRHNTLIKPDIPQVLNTTYAEGGTIVRHREYLGPVITSATAGAYRASSYPLNPAQDTTFPWLSTIAANYEEYKPNGLMFEYRSTASDAIASSTNLALGQVMMATQYDPTDAEFSSDVELLNYTWAQSGKVSDCVHHFIECDPKQSPLAHLYTREGGYSGESDLRFSDFGRFTIATSGLQGTSVQVGQLWVTYEFILYKPKLGGAQAESGGWFHYSTNTGVDATAPLGDIATGVYDDENNLAITLTDLTNDGGIIIPAQAKPATFLVQIAYLGESTASVTAPSFGDTTDPAIQFIQHFSQNDIAQIAFPSSAATTPISSCTVWITVVGDGQPHTLVCKADPIPTASSVDLYVAQIPYLDHNAYG